MWHETKRSITHAEELIPFYQRIFRVIFKVCFSKSYLPSWATKRIMWHETKRSITHAEELVLGYITVWDMY